MVESFPDIDYSSWTDETAWGFGDEAKPDPDDPALIPGYVKPPVLVFRPKDLEEKPQPAQGWD